MPMIGLFLAILQGVMNISLTRLVVASRAVVKVASPDGEHYHPLVASLIVFDLVGQTVFIIAAIVLLVLFFKKHMSFPKWMIVYLAATVLFVSAGYMGVQFLPAAVEETAGDEALQDVVRSAIAAAIWIPYFLRSVRVRNTFVNGAA